MDRYYCDVCPNIRDSDYGRELSLCPVEQLFTVEFEIKNKHDAPPSETLHYTFHNISKNNMDQQNVESMLSRVGFPNEAFQFVVPKVLECADEIANRTYKDRKLLSIVVYILVSQASDEDEINVDYDSGFEEYSEEGDQDFGLVPSAAAVTSIDEGLEMMRDADDDDYDGGFEEYFEEAGDEDFGLVPASVKSIEELEMVRVEKEENCAICFEDFHDVGVRMPCLHMFHKDCITSWLQAANSCPLCRFQMNKISEE
ncbi:probable E3 ubiquitin-protein ligase RHC2A [Lotus japonicus]|uniref:probable E3 ubiquitin-protein ligase RHC2A n=1 Tax=Lotus japonicus TaxID=34305 RepID=UPI00258D5314|nr:probable E3 ubiquitin-protein ligase RHC2A [Lotus japonicus]